jgi:hypothetical protein
VYDGLKNAILSAIANDKMKTKGERKLKKIATNIFKE